MARTYFLCCLSWYGNRPIPLAEFEYMIEDQALLIFRPSGRSFHMTGGRKAKLGVAYRWHVDCKVDSGSRKMERVVRLE